MLIPIICLSVITAFIIILITLFFFVVAGKTNPKAELAKSQLPHISVLVAARNEEHNIIHCLRALSELDYPKEKLEILVGDDASEDKTSELVTQFAKQQSNIKLFSITQTIGKAKGKANVLAQLAHKANGAYFLITDADITVSTCWAKELVLHFTDAKMGIVSGITLVHGPTLLQKLQGIDWLYFMGLLKGFDNAGLHCAAVGNNMIIKKEAYQSVGGYENIDFSVTEDYKLYKEVCKKGWKAQIIMTRNSLNISQPVTHFLQLMHQRKRWLKGGQELPFYWWFLFGILGLFLPAIIVLAVYQPILALKLYLTKVALQTLFVLYMQQKLGIRQRLLTTLLYDVYANIISITTQIFYLLPITMQWKKRKY